MRRQSSSGEKRYALKKMLCHSSIEIDRAKGEIDIHRRFGAHENILALEAYSIDNSDDIAIAYNDTGAVDLSNAVRVLLLFPFYKVCI